MIGAKNTLSIEEQDKVVDIFRHAETLCIWNIKTTISCKYIGDVEVSGERDNFGNWSISVKSPKGTDSYEYNNSYEFEGERYELELIK
jgi:hypothetical protein